MGLGKTLQAIALMAYMVENDLDRGRKPRPYKSSRGPFLILSPLSVLPNWLSELQRFLPSLTAWGYSGDKEEREALQLRVHEHVMKQPKDQVGVHW